MEESLIPMPLERWSTVQETFKTDLPRGISGLAILGIQREFITKGLDYGFIVLCPFGDPWNGMVAINEKDAFYEIVIQCPKDDTNNLEKALKSTKLIDWRRKVIVPFAPHHIIECIQRVVTSIGVEIEHILMSDSFILYQDLNPAVIGLPPSITFGPVTLENAELVNSKWPHKYPDSIRYFHLLIKADLGFGLFENQALVSWVFINEAGTLGHLYTIEEHRKKGHGVLLLKLVCNHILKSEECVFAFCVKGNEAACKLYRKIGFKIYGSVGWCYLKPDQKSKNSALGPLN